MPFLLLPTLKRSISVQDRNLAQTKAKFTSFAVPSMASNLPVLPSEELTLETNSSPSDSRPPLQTPTFGFAQPLPRTTRTTTRMSLPMLTTSWQLTSTRTPLCHKLVNVSSSNTMKLKSLRIILVQNSTNVHLMVHQYGPCPVKTAPPLLSKISRLNSKLPKHASTPLPTDYHPELNSSPEPDHDDCTLFQEIIGIIRWATEIG